MAFTHLAAHHARVATPNALFGLRRTVDPLIPRVTFTRPEVASVGLSPADAATCWEDRAIVARADAATLDRAITDDRPHGVAILIADPRGRLVGATVVAGSAGEMISGLAARIRSGISIGALSSEIHPYPTMAELPARAADAWVLDRYSRPAVRSAARVAIAARRLVGRAR